jgi:zinc protease
MKRIPPVLAVASLLIAAPVSGHASTAATGPAGASTAPGARIVTLRNGLRLLLAPDSLATAVDVAVWYDAGSRHDRAGKTGIAHLFEHLMFGGSSRYGPGEHGRLVREEGGQSGAYAAADFTCFYETLPPDDLELAIRLEADRMTGLRITQKGVDEERRLVAGERARNTTEIGRGLERLYAMAFKVHPYRWPVYGLEEDLPRLTLKDCLDFYRAHFGPARAVVTIVGNFDPDQAVAWAKEHFEPLKDSGRPGPPPPSEEPQTGERRATAPGESPSRILMVGWRVPPRTDPDWPALSVLQALLTRGRAARLDRALVTDQALCLSVQGDMSTRKDGSLFFLAAEVSPRADSAEVEARLFDEVSRVASGPVSAEELERARRQVETSVWFGLPTTRARAQALGNSQILTGDALDLDRQLGRIRTCTAEDLRRAARLLDPARREVLWLMPAGGGQGEATGGQR